MPGKEFTRFHSFSVRLGEGTCHSLPTLCHSMVEELAGQQEPDGRINLQGTNRLCSGLPQQLSHIITGRSSIYGTGQTMTQSAGTAGPGRSHANNGEAATVCGNIALEIQLWNSHLSFCL